MARDYIIDNAEDPSLGQEDTERQRNASAPVDPETTLQQIASNVEFGARFSETLEAIGNQAVAVISSDDESADAKQRILMRMLSSMLPAALREVGSAMPNADRSLVISRTTILAKEIGGIVQQMEKTKQEATINPNSPRFQEAIAIFLEDVSIAFNECAPSLTQKDTFFNALADRLRGWEERVEGLNGASAAARAKKVNPHTLAMLKPGETEEVAPNRMN